MNDKEMKQLVNSLSKNKLFTLRVLIDYQIEKLSLDLNNDFQAFYFTIDKCLLPETGKKLLPFQRFRASYKKVSNKLEFNHHNFLEWVKAVTSKEDLSSTEKSRLYYLFCNLVISGLRDYNIPVSFNSFVNLSDRFQEFFDKAFPSYVASGVASFILLGQKTLDKEFTFDHDDTISTTRKYKEIYETVVKQKPFKRERN